MNYGFRTIVDLPFDAVVDKTITCLKENGFGVLCNIDVQETLKKKLNKSFKQYRILGACNPPRAYAALQSEKEIGLLLPCNVIVYESEEGVTVSAIDPMALFSVVDNDSLVPIAKEVGHLLKKVIDSI